MLRNDLYRPWFGESDVWGVEITDGEFSGSVVAIEKLDFVEPEEGNPDSGNINLEYHVIRKGFEKTEEDYKTKMFSDVMSIIIEDVLKEAIAIHEQETRNNDSKESNSQ